MEFENEYTCISGAHTHTHTHTHTRKKVRASSAALARASSIPSSGGRRQRSARRGSAGGAPPRPPRARGGFACGGLLRVGDSGKNATKSCLNSYATKRGRVGGKQSSSGCSCAENSLAAVTVGKWRETAVLRRSVRFLGRRRPFGHVGGHFRPFAVKSVPSGRRERGRGRGGKEEGLYLPCPFVGEGAH